MIRIIDEFLIILSEAPETQIDKSITDKIEELPGKECQFIIEQLIKLRDDCVFAGLSSDFAIDAISIAIDMAQEQLELDKEEKND